MKEEIKETIGGVCSAAISSFCCWGPLLLALFGLGSAGITGVFARFRFVFIMLAMVMLGRALYLAYQRQNQRNIVITWIVVIIALAFMSFPYLRVYLGI